VLPNFFSKIFFDGVNIYFFLVPELTIKFMVFLKQHSLSQVNSLTELTCIDKLASNGIKARFQFFFVLTSLVYNYKLFIYSTLVNNFFPSLSKNFKSSVWLEREIWDMFGLVFMSHPDLRRILTDYGFFGYPLRKDFPITGFVEIRYSELHKRIVTLELSLVQEFRNMDLVNPWLDT
jgi:NADH:ubiquinone oxidoreductase subunit C